ncbi:MAG: hypothetical protein E7140_06900 [Rikenellaceae bacterium]|nr:hypothetical protein [Rikenellaceae bacterium]
MEATNFIQILRKINRGVSFNLWRVRIGGLEMALFFLFAIGEKFVCRFIPMEPDTQYIVSETMNCIGVLILGEAILRSLYKLFPRYRWATLLAMIGGAVGGLLITIVMDHFDKEVTVDTNDLIALGVCVALFIAAYLFWRHSVNRVKRLKLERELARKRRVRRA